MRIGFIYAANAYSNSQYRALMPMSVLRARGHEVPWWGASTDALPLAELNSCDVVHVYRAAKPEIISSLAKLRSAGVAIVWDNDDDVTALPQHIRARKGLTALHIQSDFATQVKAIRLAHTVTTTSSALAECFRDVGAQHVRLIENYLPPEFAKGNRIAQDGLTIGWVAALEHEADAALLDIGAVLLSALEAHPHVRVVTIGVDLRLRHPRYICRRPVLFQDLGQSIREFDIGIAPLADIPFNRARSNVKLKEYAIAGVPWLASPVGEYATLGAKHGGRLVADGDWYRAIDHLVRNRGTRVLLRTRGKLWGRAQTIDLNVDRWESVFLETIRRARVE